MSLVSRRGLLSVGFSLLAFVAACNGAFARPIATSSRLAIALLTQADDSVKRAIVMAQRNVGATEAQALLDAANGFLQVTLTPE